MNNIDICNMALSHIGKATITDLNENNEASRQCKRHYDHTRKMLLRNYIWGFSKRIVALAPLPYKHPKYEYAYAYPNKY